MYTEIYDENVCVLVERNNRYRKVAFRDLKAGDIIQKGQCRTSVTITVAEDARCLQDENFPSWVVYDTIGIGHFPDEFGADIVRVNGVDLPCNAEVCIHNAMGKCEIPALVNIGWNGVCEKLERGGDVNVG